MRWLAPLALIVAALTLALQFTSSPIGQLPRVHYQLFATGSGEGTSHVIRLDTDTGEMVAFVITVLVAYAYIWRRGGLEWD